MSVTEAQAPAECGAPEDVSGDDAGSFLDGEDGDGDDGHGEPGAGPHATLFQQGPQLSAGSNGHPDACQPCTFYCFTRRGCNRGLACKFCHLSHQSKLQQRRENWKRQQREKRKALRERVAVEAGMRRGADRDRKSATPPLGGARSKALVAAFQGAAAGSKGAAQDEDTAALSSRLSGGQPAMLYYEPRLAILTVGQEVDIQPIMSAVPTGFRLMSSLPQGLTLNPLSGCIGGTATAAYARSTVSIEMDMLGGGLLRASVDLEVIDFTRGGYVVGHMSEVEPGRFMLLLHVPEDGNKDGRGPEATDQTSTFPLLGVAGCQGHDGPRKPRTQGGGRREKQVGMMHSEAQQGGQRVDWW